MRKVKVEIIVPDGMDLNDVISIINHGANNVKVQPDQDENKYIYHKVELVREAEFKTDQVCLILKAD